ncbi:MAG: ammonia-forming cytochrome c nitrite reductase subunit c552 [Candidatus Koribacter versatilis]|uniref:Ammonia-forming cytochrome c nitrite reductase subunit c552 n=1 Tax=Candidatus Korobacter versatilis TaxID=658062 RepID=A0A932ENV7_9BACT|nr:ammonia-forming cytochrome c nitrite reductase subunit c552 [Candidatus Koribacter versatilis]
MGHRSRTIALLAIIFGIALLYSALAATPPAGQSTGQKAAPASAPASAQDSDYVGQETCVTCHDEQGKHFANTPMGKAFSHPKTAAEKLGCEACHGPGKGHVEAGGGKETIPVRFTKDSKNSAEEKNSACLTCHERGNRLFWPGSSHESRNIACVDCHVGHTPQTKKLTSDSRFSAPLTDVHSLKQGQPELCLTCHQMRRAQLQRSSHMPYREGKVTCTSCHNPHGTPNPKQLIQATTNENCLSCHTERRGPFLWEHPPVMENCANCHEPHGTNNPQLLKVRMPRVCDTCHVSSRHPTTPTLLNSVRDFNRGCTNCHSAIHGSNHPSGATFLR